MTIGGNHRPSMMTRLAAALHGEVAATTVEAYRRAGAVAYHEQMEAEKLRTALTELGSGLWGASPSQGSQFLCTWNAFALQTLGDEFVEADYRASPRTVGYLPDVTARQAAEFLGEVEHWSSRARRAAHDTTYDVSAEVSVPVPLPKWITVEPCPRSHLDAMLAAARAMRGRAEAALADLTRTPPPEDKQDAVARLRGMAAESDSVVSYGESMWSPDATDVVHERVEDSLRRGISSYYRLGQLLAMPALLGRPELTHTQVSGKPLPRPGQAGFDQWCLTDPNSLSHWREDTKAWRAIDSLWRFDPDPAATVAIQSQINAAVASGAITLETSSGHRHYYCCPWAAIYEVRRPVTIANHRLRPMQQFAFDVSAEDMGKGGEFVRQLITGPFHVATTVDYCDPEGDDD